MRQMRYFLTEVSYVVEMASQNSELPDHVTTIDTLSLNIHSTIIKQVLSFKAIQQCT